MKQISPEETQLVGRWRDVGGTLEADAVASRIDRLVADELVMLAESSDGWSQLYRDPVDGRLWELTYPTSEMAGGGPPTLTNISEQEARTRYRIGKA